MRLLLDTHALLWWLSDDPSLSTEAQSAISDPGNLVAVSAASAWEMSIKHALGKLVVPDDLGTALRENGFEALPITVNEGLVAGGLPRHHDDPFDRMLVAQAQLGDFVLVTRDSRFASYAVRTLAA